MTLDDLETCLAKIFLDKVGRNLVVVLLLFPGIIDAFWIIGFEDNQAAPWLQGRVQMSENGLVLWHFMVGVHDKRSIEDVDRQLRIVGLAEDNGDVVQSGTLMTFNVTPLIVFLAPPYKFLFCCQNSCFSPVSYIKKS